MIILVLSRKQWPQLPWVYGPFPTEQEAKDFFEEIFERKDKIAHAHLFESGGCARCKKLRIAEEWIGNEWQPRQ